MTTEPPSSERVNQRLQELYERHAALGKDGIAKCYEPGREYVPPELAGDAPSKFGISLCTLDGELHSAGDHAEPFALQSLSKVFVYALALEDHGRDHVLEHVGVEPSGDAFSSIAFDERNNRPYNPMVNAGALVTTDLVSGKDPAETLERILALLRLYAGNDTLEGGQAHVRARDADGRPQPRYGLPDAQPGHALG